MRRSLLVLFFFLLSFTVFAQVKGKTAEFTTQYNDGIGLPITYAFFSNNIEALKKEYAAKKELEKKYPSNYSVSEVGEAKVIPLDTSQNELNNNIIIYKVKNPSDAKNGYIRTGVIPTKKGEEK